MPNQFVRPEEMDAEIERIARKNAKLCGLSPKDEDELVVLAMRWFWDVQLLRMRRIGKQDEALSRKYSSAGET